MSNFFYRSIKASKLGNITLPIDSIGNSILKGGEKCNQGQNVMKPWLAVTSNDSLPTSSKLLRNCLLRVPKCKISISRSSSKWLNRTNTCWLSHIRISSLTIVNWQIWSSKTTTSMKHFSMPLSPNSSSNLRKGLWMKKRSAVTMKKKKNMK